MTGPLYRPHILEHARSPRNRGVAVNATHAASKANVRCGDRCSVSVRVEEGERATFSELRFDGTGCALSIAAASILAETLEGESFNNAAMDDAAFLQLLGIEVTSGRIDCVLLPLLTLRSALLCQNSS